MFVRPVMLVRQARGLGRQARGPQAPAAGNPESCAALGYRHRSLSELVDHLLRRMSPLGHPSPFLRPNTNILPGPVFGYRSLNYRISSKSCITFGPSGWVHPLFWGGNSLEGGNMLALAGIVYRTWRDVGQTSGLAFAGGPLIRGAQGRHKACPYRSGEREGGQRMRGAWAGGLPLPEREGEQRMRGAWAGTRPAPTGPLRGKAGVGAGRGRETACGGRHCWLDTMLGKNTHGGETGRGVAGAQPLHKGGPKARPPRTAVVSGQWLVVSG